MIINTIDKKGLRERTLEKFNSIKYIVSIETYPIFERTNGEIETWKKV